MSIIGAVAGAGLQTLGQYWLNRRAAKDQRRLTLEMWNRQNEYNHPAQQMERLKSAGINPHMAYAKGTINNVAAKPGEFPAAAAPNLEGVLSQFADISVKQAQANNLKAQTENLQQKTKTEELTTLLTGAKAKTAELERFFFEDSYGTRQSLLDVQLVNGVLDANLKEFEKKLNSHGLTKSDQLLWRQIFNIGKQAGIDVRAIYSKHKTTIDKIFGKDHAAELQRLLKGN